MNHLENIPRLNNRYVLQRHGKSRANERGLIISNPEIGTIAFGLVLNGIIEARFSARRAKNQGFFADRSTVIISSDFKRAEETALVTQSELGDHVEIVKNPQLQRRLRERYFGIFEGKSNLHYQEVWSEDKKDASHKKWGGESVDEVVDRTTSLITDLEKLYTGFTIVLVSHGDTLQILETAFRRMKASDHRDVPHLKTGEMRETVLKRRNVSQWIRAKGNQLIQSIQQVGA